MKANIDAYTAPVSDYKSYNGGLGKDSLYPYIVSRRRVDQEWPSSDKHRIRTAQINYDRGLVEMVTGRDGDFIILYAIPRKVPLTNRQAYFTCVDPRC